MVGHGTFHGDDSGKAKVVIDRLKKMMVELAHEQTREINENEHGQTRDTGTNSSFLLGDITIFFSK